jgi:cell division protein FtsI (penicillin-binding protein 3)
LQVRRDILWRVYLAYLGIALLGLSILARIVYIQQVQGSYWRGLSDSLHLEIKAMDADRGTIYSEDGSMLSSSIPYFDVRVDFGAEGLRGSGAKTIRGRLDSLADGLAAVFGDKSAAEYRKELADGYAARERYHLLKRNITFREYQEMRNLPFLKGRGPNRTGFIFQSKEKRLTPFGLLANRTIGLAREYTGADGKTVSNNVGLELTYDTVLRGQQGNRLMRRIAGGAFVPIEGTEIEPVNGRDLLTTIDINVQDIAEQALLRMMVSNEAIHGTCIVMEVATGKVKAIANLGLQPDGTYFEDLNYAIRKSEPGSTFKLFSLMSLLEDGYIGMESIVDIEKGVWKTGGRTVWDSERHQRTAVTVRQAFELSSNVGMAKLVSAHYGARPEQFIQRIRSLGLDSLSGIGIVGEAEPVVLSPKSRHWSAVALPWMAFGYNLELTPMHTLMLYNAVANGGRMMRPYLVNAIMKDGKVVQSFEPVVAKERICSEATLRSLTEGLEGVVKEGTGKSLQTPLYRIAGKTGTAQVANGSNGYLTHTYQSSFAGFFPADKPRYSCIVVIRNRPNASKYYGGQVAGPVFREIADRLYAMDVRSQPFHSPARRSDSAAFAWAGWRDDFRLLKGSMGVTARDSSARGQWVRLSNEEGTTVMRRMTASADLMPSLQGMGLRDAVYLLENMKLKVVPRGRGKVRSQSIQAGARVQRGQTVYLEMGLP